jgi:hypothetical protein
MKCNRREQVAQLSVLGQGRELLPVILLYFLESYSCVLGGSYDRHQTVKEDVLIDSLWGSCLLPSWRCVLERLALRRCFNLRQRLCLCT